MRVRSRWFVLSGALGGLAGFAMMELVSTLVPGAGTRSGDILRMSVYFAGFGLAVGGALGVTEGVVLKRAGRLFYGLILGLLLGGAGGFAGGAVGQFIYGLAPLRYAGHSAVDIAISLDASGSMGGFFFFGNDPRGKRKEAAQQLIDRVSDADRIAIIDFNSQARMLYSLSAMSSATARSAAKRAVDEVGAWDGTNLSAGLDAAIQELIAKRESGRRQFVIFLTDGVGDYTPRTAEQAKQAGITIYTVGLGSEVSADLLLSIATATGGRYYPVENASALTVLFEQIFTQNIDMASGAHGLPAAGAQPLTSPAVLLLLRVLSWAAMGLTIGFGQGVRENTREDLRACSLGGLIGGAVGGALFDPMISLLTVGGGLAGRCLADVVVGACIGGSMRLAQARMVEATGKETRQLVGFLPKKGALNVLPVAQAVGSPPAGPRGIPPQSPDPSPVARPLLASFEAGNDRERAMALAYHSGHYALREIAKHFGVSASSVKRAADEHRR